MISLEKTFKFTSVFFNSLGQNVVKAHVRRVRNDKLDHKGKKFADYTTPYKKRKKAGKAAPKGKTQISRSATPDLTLTGDMLNSMRLIVAEPNGFRYGITDSKQAQKLIGNQTGIFGNKINTKKKRIISSGDKLGNAVPQPIQKMIAKEMSKQIVRQISEEVKKHGLGVKVYEI